MKKGYREAYSEYDNDWTLEVDRIGKESYTSDSETLCGYIKVISEFGIFTLIFLIVYIYKLRKKCDNEYLEKYMWIMLYLYMQFESYAFYTIWLYIVFLKIYEKEKMGENDGSRKNICKNN